MKYIIYENDGLVVTLTGARNKAEVIDGFLSIKMHSSTDQMRVVRNAARWPGGRGGFGYAAVRYSVLFRDVARVLQIQEPAVENGS